jgi:CBS domain-containing protein
MVQRNIDHLPVLRQKQIAGMLTSDAIVFRLTPPERIARESIVAEEQRRLDMKVTALMASDPTTCSPDTDVSQVVQQMGRRAATYSLVALWDELQGIITYRDCVKLLAEPTEETLPISIVGLPQDPFEAEAAKAKFEHVVKRLTKSIPDLLEARSIIKTSKKAGHTSHYEVEVELITSRKTTSYGMNGRSLPEIFDELSTKMKRLTTKKPRPRRERPE